MGFGLGAFVQDIHGQPYINFIAPGIVASSSVFAAVYECTYGTYIRMTFQKTFDAILATPVNLDDLVAGELIWGATKSVIFGITIMIVIALFGLVDSWLIVLAIPFIFLGGLIFAELSVMFCAIVPGIDSFSYFYTLFMTPLFLFSGIFFPLDAMPRVVSNLAFFLAALSPREYLPRLFRGQHRHRAREHGMAGRRRCPPCDVPIQAHEKEDRCLAWRPCLLENYVRAGESCYNFSSHRSSTRYEVDLHVPSKIF